MTNTKITKREKYEAMINVLTAASETEDVVMLIEFCQSEIEALDRKAAKAKERKAEKDKEADGVYATVLKVLEATDAGTFITIPAILATIGDDTITAGKVTPRLTAMINDGLVEKKNMVTEDKRRINGYALVRN